MSSTIKQYMKIGDNLKRIRESLGESQTKFAERLDISRSTYSNYENNNRVPDDKTLQRIADTLEISVFEIMQPPPLLGILSHISIYKEFLGELNALSKDLTISLKSLKEQLKANPGDEDLIRNIEKVDEELDSTYRLIETYNLKLQDQQNEKEDAQNKAGTYVEFGDFFSDEKDKIAGKAILVEIENTNRETLLNKFDKLNPKGKYEAIKRVDELGRIDEYKNQEENS